MSKVKTSPRGRDSSTGKFITIDQAKRRPNTTTIERVPKPGYGDTKRRSKKK
jgi:hypothetical protein